jgi:hypothetical protein
METTVILPSEAVRDFAIGQNLLAVGGVFTSLFGKTEGEITPSTSVRAIGLWDGAQWRSPGRGLEIDQVSGDGQVRVTSGSVSRLEIIGNKVVAIGNFTRAGGVTVQFYAVWESAP